MITYEFIDTCMTGDRRSEQLREISSCQYLWELGYDPLDQSIATGTSLSGRKACGINEAEHTPRRVDYSAEEVPKPRAETLTF